MSPQRTEPAATGERAITGALLGLMLAGLCWGLGGELRDLVDRWSHAGRTTTPVWAGVVVVGLAAWLRTWANLGPIAVAPAALQWVPQPPRPLSGVLRTMLGAIVVAAPFAVIAAGVRYPEGPTEAAWVGGTVVAVGLGGALLALVAEYADCSRALLGTTSLAIPVALALLAWSAAAPWWAALALLWATASLLSGARSSGRRLPRRPGGVPPRWWLIRAAAYRWAWQAGATLVDGAVVRQFSERWGRARAGWPRRSPRLPWSGPTRFTTRLVRLLPLAVATALAAVGSAYLVGGMVAGDESALAVVVLAIGWLSSRISGALDGWAQAPSLRRSHAAMSTAEMLLPDLVALTIPAVLAVGVLWPGPWAALVLLAVGPLAVLRRYGSRVAPQDGLVAMPTGALPVELVDRLIAGWDVIVLALLALALIPGL